MRAPLLLTLVAVSASAQGVTADIYDGPSASALLMRSHPASNGVGFDLFTAAQMTDGWMLYLCNLYQPVLGVDFAGNAFIAGGLNVGNTITLNGGGSGAVALSASDGLYLPIAGALPSPYWGVHGAVTLVNTHPMSAGYLFELNNPQTGGTADKKLMVTNQGGITQSFSALCEAQFPPCGNYQNAPVDDGGAGYFVATDAGVSQDGTLMFDVCTHREKQCVVDGVSAPYPAGVWLPIRLAGD